MKNFYARKRFLTTFLLAFFYLGTASAQTIASDDARSTAYSTDAKWANQTNGGSGFSPWSLTGGGGTGFFIGNPANDGMGTSGIDTVAFGMFATGTQYANARRTFSTPMKVGEELTFYWAMNWDASTGNKGFDLLANDSITVFNVNNGGTSAIILDISAVKDTAFRNYGVRPILVTLLRATTSTYVFSMTSRDSSERTFTKTFNSSQAINGMNLYIGDQRNSDGRRNIYFNKFKIAVKGAELTTAAATAITRTTATSGGNITNDGGAAITERGIVWSTTANPTVSLTTKTASGTGTGTFSSNLTGLTANTTYYVRAYATNSRGTFYGNEITFRTTADSITQSVSDWNRNNILNIYPNPVFRGGALQIEFNSLNPGKYTVSLFNITGARLQQSVMIHSGNKSIHNLSIPSSIAPGLYFAEITGSGKKETLKLVIQ